MRVRYVSVTYSFGSASQSLERHYRDLRDDLLRQSHNYGRLQGISQWRPPVDIHETPTTILVKLELAGLSDDQMELTLYPNALVVTGRREDDSDHDEELCYHEAQVHYGPFRAEILLPAAVMADAVDAIYENGFLRVRLPKVTSDPGGSGGTERQEAQGEKQSSTTRGRLHAQAPLTHTEPTAMAGAPRTAKLTPMRSTD